MPEDAREGCTLSGQERPMYLSYGDTGEVLGAVHKIRPSGSHRAGQVDLLMAFCSWAQDHNILLGFWTIGTPEKDPDRVAAWWASLMKALPPVRWAGVIEPGEKAGRWHIHMLLEGYWPQAAIRQLWMVITGIPGCHVRVTPVYSDGVAPYMAKYMGKSTAAAIGIRKFRTSKRLRRLVHAYMPVRHRGAILAFTPNRVINSVLPHSAAHQQQGAA